MGHIYYSRCIPSPTWLSDLTCTTKGRRKRKRSLIFQNQACTTEGRILDLWFLRQATLELGYPPTSLLIEVMNENMKCIRMSWWLPNAAHMWDSRLTTHYDLCVWGRKMWNNIFADITPELENDVKFQHLLFSDWIFLRREFGQTVIFSIPFCLYQIRRRPNTKAWPKDSS